MKKYKTGSFMYAPLEGEISANGSASQSLYTSKIVATDKCIASCNYATKSIACHPAFTSGLHINNSSGAVYRTTAWDGRPFPKQGTIEFWIRPSTSLSNYDGLFSTNANSVTGTNSNKIKAFVDLGTLTVYFMGSSYSGLACYATAANTSYLVTVTWDFNRNYAAVYRNGVIDSSSSGITTSYQPSTWQTIEIGRAERDLGYYTPDSAFNGVYISERFTSLAEHTAVYSSGKRKFITHSRIPIIALPEAKRPPLVAIRTEFSGDPHYNNIVLQMPLRSHLRDESKTRKAVTVNGNTKVVNDAAYFDGAGDYLSLADSADWDLNTDFTIEFWGYALVKGSTSSGHIIGQINSYGALTNCWGIATNDTSIGMSASTGGGTWDILTGCGVTIDMTATVWRHYAFVRAGNTVTIYINGVAMDTGTVTGTFNSSHALTIGRTLGYDENSLSGYLKDLRITKGVARYTSNFTPSLALPAPHGVAMLTRRIPTYMKSSTKSLFIISKSSNAAHDRYFNNVVLQAKFYNNLFDESKLKRKIELFGGAELKGDAVYSATASQYILAETLTIGTNQDFTIEGWWKLTNDGDLYQYLFYAAPLGIRFGNTGFGQKLQWSIGSFATVGVCYSCSITQNYANGKWLHIALVRKNNNIYLYVDGTLYYVNSGANPTTYPNAYYTNSSSVPTASLSFLTDNYYGYMKNVRFTVGIARYTNNFNPKESLPYSNLVEVNNWT